MSRRRRRIATSSKALRKSLKLEGEITLDQVLRGPGVLDSDSVEIETETAWPALQKALKAALEQFVKMRKQEGEALAADLRKRVLAIQKNVKTIGVLAPKVMEHHRGTLLERAAKAGLEIEASDERLLKEIVFFADRSDISEELTRLRSHLDQFFDATRARTSRWVARSTFCSRRCFARRTRSATRPISSPSARSSSA